MFRAEISVEIIDVLGWISLGARTGGRLQIRIGIAVGQHQGDHIREVGHECRAVLDERMN